MIALLVRPPQPAMEVEHKLVTEDTEIRET
jgi:hypothetical protein